MERAAGFRIEGAASHSGRCLRGLRPGRHPRLLHRCDNRFDSLTCRRGKFNAILPHRGYDDLATSGDRALRRGRSRSAALAGKSRAGGRKLARPAAYPKLPPSRRRNSFEIREIGPLPASPRRLKSFLQRLTGSFGPAIFCVSPEETNVYRGEWLEAGKAADSRRD